MICVAVLFPRCYNLRFWMEAWIFQVFAGARNEAAKSGCFSSARAWMGVKITLHHLRSNCSYLLDF